MAGFAEASSNWRSYKKICRGNKACMKEQAASYTALKSFSKDISKPCTERFVTMYNWDYRSAYHCAKDEADRRTEKKYMQAKTKEMNARANFLNDPTITVRHGYTVYGAQPQQRATRKPAPETTRERMYRLLRERDRKQ